MGCSSVRTALGPSPERHFFSQEGDSIMFVAFFERAFLCKRVVPNVHVVLWPGLWFFLLCGVALSSRTKISATLSGTVTDQSGASIAGADVTVQNVKTGALRNTATDGTGRYAVFALPIG